ncbi:MAG: hypothetical protein JWN71_4187 [Xanthobacteraceae bacterium]|nr:hypothetical protein [Xanthobacteraceae bacterium]
MSDNNSRNQPVPMGRPSPPTTITIGGTPTIDLSFLPDHQREALMNDYARGVVNVAQRAHELQVDVNVLRSTLDNLAATTKDVSESGNAITVSHTQTTKIGRTEIKMGNTDEAKSGKLSRTQAGERDWTPFYIFAGIAAVVLIAAIMMR